MGFFWTTVALYHATFCINSLAHVHGDKVYVTGDDSRNNWILAFFTMGEGWHNNHHAYQRMAAHGHRWWEFDPTYWVIRVMESLGLAWDVVHTPQGVGRKGSRRPAANHG